MILVFVLTKNLFQFQISVFPGHWNVAKHFILEHLGGRSWSFVEMKQVAVGLWSPLAWEEPKREPPRLIVLTQHLPSQLISAGPSRLLLFYSGIHSDFYSGFYSGFHSDCPKISLIWFPGSRDSRPQFTTHHTTPETIEMCFNLTS